MGELSSQVYERFYAFSFALLDILCRNSHKWILQTDTNIVQNFVYKCEGFRNEPWFFANVANDEKNIDFLS